MEYVEKDHQSGQSTSRHVIVNLIILYGIVILIVGFVWGVFAIH
jgi:hypothetical protein